MKTSMRAGTIVFVATLSRYAVSSFTPRQQLRTLNTVKLSRAPTASRSRWNSPSRIAAVPDLPRRATGLRATTTNTGNDISSKFDSALEEGRLREAVALLKSNSLDDLDVTTLERFNQIFAAIEQRTANAEENTVNLRQAAEFPPESMARKEMADMYNTMVDKKALNLFGAASATVGQLSTANSHSVPPSLLEEVSELPMSALTPQPTNTVLLAGIAVAFLQLAVSAWTGINLTALALASLAAVTVDRLFVGGAIFETFVKLFSPGINERIVRHEAGHFLAAYLLGCPVEGIVLSAWQAIQDERFGGRSVSAGTSFFDPELSRQINSQGTVTRSSIDRYSIIVMAGIAAEAAEYGRADGGAGDEMALVAFLGQLGGGPMRAGAAATVWNNDAIRNQARWGAMQCILLLRHYKPAYDALVEALDRGASLGECIFAIETAAAKFDLRPLKQPLGYIVEDRTKGTVKWSTEPQEEPPTLTVPTRPSVVDGEESLATLAEYRREVEEKLQLVEQQLKDLQG